MIRKLCVCIDDFGLHDGVNESALRLAQARRVSAVSCMTQGPAWRDGAKAWQGACRDQVDLGLHLNLTERFPASRIHGPLSTLWRHTYLRQLDPMALQAEIRAQWDAFEDALGTSPDFVDGHQHVHQLPQVREALMQEIQSRRGPTRPWVRNTQPPPHPRPQLKQRVIAALGSRALAKLAHAQGLPQNAHLLGVYDFKGSAARYAAHLADWCAQASDGDLLMCHPATRQAAHDPIAEARVWEHEVWLAQSEGLLMRHHLQLHRPSLAAPAA